MLRIQTSGFANSAMINGDTIASGAVYMTL